VLWGRRRSRAAICRRNRVIRSRAGASDTAATRCNVSPHPLRRSVVGGRRSAVELPAAPAPGAARAPRETPRALDPSATRSTRTARLGSLLGPFGHRPLLAHRRIADRLALAQRQSRVRSWPDADVQPPGVHDIPGHLFMRQRSRCAGILGESTQSFDRYRPPLTCQVLYAKGSDMACPKRLWPRLDLPRTGHKEGSIRRDLKLTVSHGKCTPKVEATRLGSPRESRVRETRPQRCPHKALSYLRLAQPR